MANTGKDDRAIRKALFDSTMKGEWDKVKEIYKLNPDVHKKRIISSGSTALHIAVSAGEEATVEELVGIICEAAQIEAFRIKDDRGNTPLHKAAALGSLRMCGFITGSGERSSLIAARNHDGETPFFLAALHGHRAAFLLLHSLCGAETGYSYSRREDGETILHCSADYFELAFQIIHLYPELVNRLNERGQYPLHILATKPSAFRSGSHLGRFEGIIYHCIFVDELQEVPEDKISELLKSKSTDQKNTDKGHHKNHETVRNIVIISGSDEQGENITDTENPPMSEDYKSRNEGDQQTHQLFPFHFVKKLVSKTLMLIDRGLGSNEIRKIREKKEQHTWSVRILDKILKTAAMYEFEYEYEDDGSTTADYKETFGVYSTPPPLGSDCEDTRTNIPSDKGEKQENAPAEMSKKQETPLLVAAMNGITEIVKSILQQFPVAIHDVNSEKKNIVLLAVENRQPHVYRLLLQITTMKESVFRKVDNKGNSALHLAATLGDPEPWLIPGAALQVQWKLKWYEFVKDSMPFHFFARFNKEGKTPRDIFTETHKDLVKASGKWLTNTSQSCSVVAALIAAVAFATSTTVPGGVEEKSGTPTLENEPPFSVFAISSLVALCSSITALVMFLAILTSRQQEKDYAKDLPRKLLIGLTSLFVSIASMLVSFCAGHFFVLKDKLKYAAFPVYVITCLPVTFFAVVQFPLYFDLVRANFKHVPWRR